MAARGRLARLFGCLGPPILIPIVLNELCERWAFYGMRAVLVLYLTDSLFIDPDDAIALYSFFMAACYFAPLLGGYLSDTYLGKFRTMVAFNFCYIVGLAVLTGSSFGASRAGSYVGLLLIALGTGGIKPCASAFGADQLWDQDDGMKSRFWLIWYFVINTGSFFSYIITPIVRANAGFPYAFLLSLVVLVISLAALLLGNFKGICGGYRKVPAAGQSFYGKFAAVMHAAWVARRAKNASTAPLMSRMDASDDSEAGHPVRKAPPPSLIRGAPSTVASSSQEQLPLINSSPSPGSSSSPASTGLAFLDGALTSSAVSARDVFGVAAVLRVLPLFLCLSAFWLAFDQQGSLMVLERKQMKTICLGGGDKGCLTPEQLGVLNPLFVVILVPVMGWILEVWRKWSTARGAAVEGQTPSCRQRLQPTLLRRMTVGLFITTAAFGLTAAVQRAIDSSEPFSVPVLTQVPQILLLTVAEVLVSATGLEWAYSQAPVEYRSSMMAFWQVSVAIGNLLTSAVFGGLSTTLSTFQILLVLTAMVFVASVIFMLLAMRYKTLVIPASALEEDDARSAAEGKLGSTETAAVADSADEPRESQGLLRSATSSGNGGNDDDSDAGHVDVGAFAAVTLNDPASSSSTSSSLAAAT